MKMTQAWGWLVAAVLAAGLNASYHDGGLQWAHEIADRAEHGSAAVLDLASGRTDQFLSEARLLTARSETSSCPFATTLARIQTRISGSDTDVERFNVMSAREESQLARLEASRARMEAQIAAQTVHIRIATAAFAPIALKSMPVPVVCPRVRLSIPRLPMVRMPALPVIHIDTASAGPI